MNISLVGGMRREGEKTILEVVGSDAQTNVYRQRVDLLLDPPIESIDLMDWHAFDRAVEAGYRSTMEALERPGVPALGRVPVALTG